MMVVLTTRCRERRGTTISPEISPSSSTSSKDRWVTNKIALMMLIDQWRGSLGSAELPFLSFCAHALPALCTLTPFFVVLRACVAGLVCAHALSCRFARMHRQPHALARAQSKTLWTTEPPFLLLTFFKKICVCCITS